MRGNLKGYLYKKNITYEREGSTGGGGGGASCQGGRGREGVRGGGRERRGKE